MFRPLYQKLSRGRFSETDRQSVGRCVFEAESRTSAELVLVVRRHSGMYRDADYLAGLACLVVGLMYSLFSPDEIHPLSIPLPLIVLFFGGALASAAAGARGPRRWFTTSGRRRTQVESAARAAFFEKDIAKLKSRTGILLYYSELEHWAVLLGDRAAQAAIVSPALREHLMRACQGPPAQAGPAIGGFIRTLGVHLGRELPLADAPGSQKSNELEDAPDL